MPTASFAWAGHVSTQMPQPVQSSGATWIVILMPGRCRSRQSFDGKPSGAPSSASGGNTFIRIAACGHTIAHLAQSMQMDGSQIGISSAIERFSQRAVPTGKVPSTGRALTGRVSPRPASIVAVIRATRSFVSAAGGMAVATAVAAVRNVDLPEPVERRVDGRLVAIEHRLAALAVGAADRLLDRDDRLVERQHAREGEEARLQHRVDTAAHSRLLRHAGGVDDEEPQPLGHDLLPDPAGRCSQTSSGPYGALSRKVAPSAATSSTSIFSSRPNWWQATKPALSIRYDEPIGRGPKRRCDTVTEPDFFES